MREELSSIRKGIFLFLFGGLINEQSRRFKTKDLRVQGNP